MPLKVAKMAQWQNQGNTPPTLFDGKFQLKGMQKAILNCLLQSDVIANLPTGFGKSLLFQYPASLQTKNKKCIIVIVPLKALLWDSIREARQLKIQAQEIDSKIINQYFRNDTLPQMLVATPQKIFASQNTLHFIQALHEQKRVRLLVIDQCHCMSEWGHDFRPAYLQLNQLRKMLSGVRVLAISATITPETRQDLAKRMYMPNAHYFQASYHRPNLHYSVLKVMKKQQYKSGILNFLKDEDLLQSSGIIYCQTISAAVQLHEQLGGTIKSGLFHSQLSQKMRKQTYDGFMSGQILTIIGTICFGMGINKKDIRYVINMGISKSTQNYYQESGRAGRDGLPAHCVVISYPNMLTSLSFLINNSKCSSKMKSHQLCKLQQMKQYADEQTDCRRTVLFRMLGENFDSKNCNKCCDLCKRDGSVPHEKVDYLNKVRTIIQSLQQSKCYFTRNQLCSFLKGKSIAKGKRGKKGSLQFGEQIKGILSKQPMQVIQQIFDKMLRVPVLTQLPIKNKYAIIYFRAGNRSMLKNLRQFQIPIYIKPQKQNNQKQKKPYKQNQMKQKLSKYIQSKKLQQQQIQKSQKNKFTQTIQQAQIIQQPTNNYQMFFTQLFPRPQQQQMMMGMDSEQQKQALKQIQTEYKEQGLGCEDMEMEEYENCHTDVDNNNNNGCVNEREDESGGSVDLEIQEMIAKAIQKHKQQQIKKTAVPSLLLSQ